jgi:outer membrane protein
MNNINHIKLIFITFFFIFLSTISKSEVKIAFIEMDTIMKESSSGKSLIQQLNKLDNNNKKYFKETKKKLSLEKKKITSQKNILSEDEFNNKIILLNKEFENFKDNGNKKIELLQTKRNIGMKKILDELNIVLSEYSKKNELTFIIDQKNIIMGKADLNITNEIIKLLNLKIKKLN